VYIIVSNSASDRWSVKNVSKSDCWSVKILSTPSDGLSLKRGRSVKPFTDSGYSDGPCRSVKVSRGVVCSAAGPTTFMAPRL